MKELSVKDYGNSSQFESNWGLKHSTSQKIAAIVAYSGSLEYYLERAIWKLENIQTKGIKPDTDSKAVTQLLSRLESFSANLEAPENKYLLRLWCETTRYAFIIRNNIVHGVPIRIEDTLAFMRNPRWHGEVRKRTFGDFWADQNTLDLICESLAVLLRIIINVESEELTINEAASPIAMKALRQAKSILGEFSSQVYNPSFETY